MENRKGAIKPWPLCTPLGLFLGVLGCGGVRLLTCVCMLRCWMCEVEPMYVDADGVGCGRRGALLSPGWLGLSGCSGVGYGRRGVFVVAWLRIFLFFACGGVGVTCIVEYWDALHRVFYRIFWKRNDDFLDLGRYSGLCGWWRMYYSGFVDLGNWYRLLLPAARGSCLICML